MSTMCSTISTCTIYSSYAQMYKTSANSCLYTSKINIYTNPAFQPVLPLQICFLPIYPPAASCNACNTCNTSNASNACASCK